MQDLLQDIKEKGLSAILERLNDLWGTTIINIGESKLTIGIIITLIISLFTLIVVSEWIRKFLVHKLLPRYHMEIGTRQSVGTILKYILITVGIVVILQNTGIDMSALGILAGALGVGIGFGLQNITNNFISGLIILFEQPIKVGDRIEVEEVNGDVIKISARSTMVVTNDNITIIVPNSQFIDNPVINWSHNDRNIRFNYPVHVSYKEDPQKVKEILEEVAIAHDGVLKSPPPDVLFKEYGDSSLDFILRVWSSAYINKPNVLKSQLYYEIFRRFREEGIQIPFPQRDLHLKSGFEKFNY